jgi:hypothetical protein
VARWNVNLQELARRYNQRFEDVARMTCIELFSRVVLRSPVDTGRFRANWQLSYASIDTSVTTSTDETGNDKIAQIRATAAEFKLGQILYFTNSLPYAAVLEYGLYPNPPEEGSKKRGEAGKAVHVVGGYSMQAPQGMVRVTVIEFDQAVNKALAAAPR